jgi:hypothetical protein
MIDCALRVRVRVHSVSNINNDQRTLLEFGRRVSEAFNEASWVSRTRTPALPMMEPMRMLGLSRRMGSAACWLSRTVGLACQQVFRLAV